MTKLQFALNVVAFVVAIVFLPFFLVFGCENGCEEYQGACACLGTPEVAPAVVPSDEKPPRSGNTATAGDMPTSLIYSDAKQDQDIKDADRQGKQAANLK